MFSGLQSISTLEVPLSTTFDKNYFVIAWDTYKLMLEYTSQVEFDAGSLCNLVTH